jgi:secondary thiamine-phosphate synthase enzyme
VEVTNVKTITIETREQNQMIDITSIVGKIVRESGVQQGVCFVFVPHTTAAVTINENADKDVPRDILNTLSKLVPYKDNYKHMEGNCRCSCKSHIDREYR